MECHNCGSPLRSDDQLWCGECGEYLPARQKDDIKDPQHYAGKYPFEVCQAIELILNTFAGELTPYEIYCLGNELKYRFRAGWKDDGEKDLQKAIRYNEMRTSILQVPDRRQAGVATLQGGPGVKIKVE
jgi:hypothetical protein